MLSRVADSLYWMSRYLERAEHTTRLLDVNLNLMLDESSPSSEHRWLRVLHALGHPRELTWGGDPYTLTRTLTFDLTHKASIVACIISARENSRHVREQISTEMWQRLNSLYLDVTRPNIEIETEGDATEFLQTITEAIHQFQGITDSTMSHGEGWQFIQVGRNIERAAATAMLLEAYHEDLWTHPEGIPEGTEYLEWMGLLRSATAFEAYCKVYTADLSPDRILEFLLLDAQFPHSLRFAIDAMQHALEAIQVESGGMSRAEPLHRLGGRLQAMLSFSSIDDVLDQGVIAVVRNIQQQCRSIHSTIYELYVDYSIQTALAG
ncbi:MAG: alpha-E domain-containing protein [Edaphobacter sp.]|uniref:alpha-E domain-containing protein n=1 Tax=Edaphobacter sp. TaxID=1934404 RepID=UPI00238D31BE|nr:alpha-E domain-containing protein [Edaphobacter sp.]MDE1176563.1 alpha-E domain-containing protein [Edaphobacter sp.]